MFDFHTVKLWRWDFDNLLREGCVFMRKYFKSNPNDADASEIDNMCDCEAQAVPYSRTLIIVLDLLARFYLNAGRLPHYHSIDKLTIRCQ